MPDIHFKTAGELLKAITAGQVDEKVTPVYSSQPDHVPLRRHLPVPDMVIPSTGEVLPATARVDYVVYHPMPAWYTLPIEEAVLALVLLNVAIWLMI